LRLNHSTINVSCGRPISFSSPRLGLQAALVPVMADLHAALIAGLTCPVKPAARFCRNLLAVDPALWTFAGVDGVEPTNNLAERTLQIAVLWRKISFGNGSQSGCRFVEHVLTTAQTMRRQERDVLGYLQAAVKLSHHLSRSRRERLRDFNLSSAHIPTRQSDSPRLQAKPRHAWESPAGNSAQSAYAGQSQTPGW